MGERKEIRMKTHHLFISHSWTYGSQYCNLVALLKKRPYFDFTNYSVPRDDPIHNARSVVELREAIRKKMAPTGAVLILAGVYAAYSKWINEEIALAKDGFARRKPIIAIEPWGSERTSKRVKEAADLIVGWNTESVVRAIRDLA